MENTRPSWEVSEELSTEDCWVSKLKVLRSAAGYYIGRECRDKDMPFDEPYSRESDYFSSKEEATKALYESGFDVRDCVENNHAYATGGLNLKAE